MGAVTSSRVDYWSWENSPSVWDAASETWDSASRKYYETEINEAVSLSERMRVSGDKPLTETFAVTDDCTHKAVVKRSWQETLAVADSKQARPSAVMNETFGIKEWFDKMMRYFKSHDETVSLAEAFNRRVIFADRRLSEHIGINDTADKAMLLMKNEDMPLISDAILENANAVMDMVSFYSGVMNEQTFLERANTVQGYSSFKEFYVGDYEYQRALVRLSVQAEQLNSGINLYNVVHNVDIPDTDDRGTVTITDATAPTRVYFNKFYYHAPEISVTLIGGNTGDGFVIPNVPNTNGQDADGRYFEVELLDVSGARKTGTVMWVSKGY